MASDKTVTRKPIINKILPHIGRIYRITPRPIWHFFSSLISLYYESKISGQYYCPVCKQSVARFKPLPITFDMMSEKCLYIHPKHLNEMMNTHAYSCPKCGAQDRERVYAMYLSQEFSKMKETGKTYNFLDFAPSPSLSKFIKKHSFINYRSADLYMKGVDDKVDITDLHIYESGSFDMILCSHVLEHVEQDIKAMKELYRVLNKDGFAIIVVPINLGLKEDFEDPTKTSESDRWKYFGQNDHVRVYSKKGFVSKLESVGFQVHQYGVDFFGMAEFERCGIHPRSILYVATK
jgi:SAM-dependent methyltransferase